MVKIFMALRRTQEGMLYYTKVNKDSETLDFQHSTSEGKSDRFHQETEYVDEDVKLELFINTNFTGDSSTTTFTLTCCSI